MTLHESMSTTLSCLLCYTCYVVISCLVLTPVCSVHVTGLSAACSDGGRVHTPGLRPPRHPPGPGEARAVPGRPHDRLGLQDGHRARPALPHRLRRRQAGEAAGGGRGREDNRRQELHGGVKCELIPCIVHQYWLYVDDRKTGISSADGVGRHSLSELYQPTPLAGISDVKA